MRCARSELGDASEFAFDAAIVGEVRSGLDAGDVAFAFGCGVLPEGQVGQLFRCESHG